MKIKNRKKNARVRYWELCQRVHQASARLLDGDFSGFLKNMYANEISRLVNDKVRVEDLFKISSI